MRQGRPVLVVTRPEAQARAFAQSLGAGADVLAAPMLEIEAIPPGPLEPGRVQAVLFTSANGVRYAPREPALEKLPAFAVGDATAAAARAAGFATVESAGGDGAALARLVADRLKPEGGALLHLSGAEVADDPGAQLRKAGFVVNRLAVYRARPARTLPGEVRDALGEGVVDAVLFFSPRGAASFVSLATRAGLERGCGNALALCLSEAVAEAARSLAWREVRHAAQPTADAMLALVAEAVPADAQSKASEANASMSKAPKDGKDRKEPTAGDGGKKKAKPQEAGAAASSVPSTASGGETRADAQRGDPQPSAAAGSGGASTPPPRQPGSGGGLPPKPAPQPAVSAGSTGRPADDGRRAGRIVMGVAAAFLLLVLVGALVATRYVWEPPVMAQLRNWFGVQPPAGSLASLRERVAALEARNPGGQTAAMEALRGQGEQLSTRMSDLVGRVDNLSRSLNELRGRVESSEPGAARQQLEEVRRTLVQRLDELERQTATALGGAQRIEALELEKQSVLARLSAVGDRLSALETELKRQTDRMSRPSALVIAVSQLRRAVEGGEGFAQQLAVVDQLAEDRPGLREAVAALQPMADGGVPAQASLRRRFDDVVRQVTAAAKGKAGDGWMDRVADQVGSLVTVRRTDMATGDSVDAIVVRAQAHLAAGDLPAAVEEMHSLPEQARQAAGPWLADAGRRLGALDAVRALEASLLSGSQAPGG
ncbi:MAG: uroporphyrinogen-III synthase [Acetobacterales bacterium]